MILMKKCCRNVIFRGLLTGLLLFLFGSVSRAQVDYTNYRIVYPYETFDSTVQVGVGYHPIVFQAEQAGVTWWVASPPDTMYAYKGGPSYGVIELDSSGERAGLPPGIILSPDGALVKLSGTPTAKGTYKFVVGFNNGFWNDTACRACEAGDQGYLALTITVSAPDITITGVPDTLSPGTYGSAYTPVTFGATGGKPTYTYKASGLPPGMSIDTSGVLSGTPAAAGTFAFSVFAYDKTPGNEAPYYGDSVFHLTINPVPLTITAPNDTMTYGASLPLLTPTYSGFVNGDIASKLTSGPFDSTTASSASPVGTYPITVSGAVDSNYTFNYVGGTMTVVPAALTVTANSDSMTYGGVVPSLSVRYSGFVNRNDSSSLTTQATDTTTATSASPVGTYPITAGGAADSNYTFNYVAGTLTVGPAVLTVTANSDSMRYGGIVPALSVSYSGFVNRDSVSKLTTQATDTTTATSASPVGTYPITAGGAVDSNYRFNYVAGAMTVGPVVLTVTANSDSMTYGGVVPPLSVRYSGFVNEDNASKLTTQDTVTTTATSASGVGSYPITASGVADSNYTINYVGGTMTVSPAALVVTANNESMSYGGTVPALTVSYSGFVNWDSASKLTTQATATTTATSDSALGTYPITAAGAADSNYTISYVPGTLTVGPATLTVTASNDTMRYGAPLPTLPVTYNGFVNRDNASKLTTQATAMTTATSDSAVGTYPITAAGATDTNYSFVYVPGTLTIDPAALVITADSESKVYGMPDPKLNYTVTRLVNGDDSSIFTGSLTRTPGENVGSYPITQGTLSAGANYVLSFFGSDLVITKASQQISWTQNLLVGCNDSTQFQLTAAASTGLPITYTTSDPGVATVAGDLLTLVQPGTAIIMASQPGDSNYLAAADVADTAIDQSASLVRQHWANVLLFDNSSGDYTQWQWYNNGIAIPGATGQYYSAPALSGQYYVIATNDSGQLVQTCPLTVAAGGAAPGGIKVSPNPVNKGGMVTITCNYTAAALQDAKMLIIDISGNVRQEIANVQPSMQVTMPAAGGIYIISLQFSNGQKASVNVLVNE